MLLSLVQIIGWIAALAMALVALLLAFNRQTGLSLIQHDMRLLPQAMLVRYAVLALLAALGAWFKVPLFLFAILLAFALIGFGDAFIYRRAGEPHWFHLCVGGVSLIGALLALITMS